MKQARLFLWVWVIFLVVAAIFILFPLTHRGFYISDDGEWMVIRLSAFYQSLAEGQFPVRMLGRLNHSFGYPVANFLYPGFLYIGSLLRFFGFSFVNAVKSIMAGSIIGAAFFLFLFLRRWFKVIPSIIGIVAFLGSPYLLYDVYHRGSVGEVLAFLPASMLLYAIAASQYWLIPFSVALLIISHNSLALILGASLGLYMMTRHDRVVLIGRSFLGLGLSAFFWIPALLERSFTRFDMVRVSDPTQYFIGSHNGFLLGVPTVLALLYGIWLYKHRTQENTIFSLLVIVGYIFALPVSRALWYSDVLPQLVQFPYRFLSIPVLFGPWLVSFAVSQLSGWRKTSALILCLGVWIYAAVSIFQTITYVDRPQGYYTTNEDTTTVHDEYLPTWVREKPLYRAPLVYEFISGEAQAQVNDLDTQTVDLSITATHASILQLNKLYYPGWGVTIDGALVPVDYQTATGVMRVSVPTGNHRLVATFRETVPRFIADMVSIFSIIWVLWTLRARKQRS